MKKVLIFLTTFFIFPSSFGMPKPSTTKKIQAFFLPLLACVSSHHKNIQLKEKQERILKEQQERIESQKIKDFAALYWALANKKNPVMHDPKPPIIGNGALDLLKCIDEYLDPLNYQCVHAFPCKYQGVNPITSLLYIPEKNYLISSYASDYDPFHHRQYPQVSSIRCDDLTTKQEIHVLNNPKVAPRNCILTANHTIAWKDVNGHVSMGNPLNCTYPTIIKHYIEACRLLAYIPELPALAIASQHALTLLNIITKKPELLMPAYPLSHPNALIYIPELKLLITGFENGALQFFNPITKTLIAIKNTDDRLVRSVNSIVYLSEQNLLAVQYFNAIEIWDPVTYTFVWKFDDKQQHYFDQPGSMVYLKDQHILACQYGHENITLWDTKNWSLNKPPHVSPVSTIEKSGCERMIYAPAIKTIITGDISEGIKMYANLVQILKDVLSKTATIKITTLKSS